MDIHEALKDIPETLRNICLWSQLAPLSRDILRNIPEILMLATVFSLLVNKGISKEYSKAYPLKMVAADLSRLLGFSLTEGYSQEYSQEYPWYPWKLYSLAWERDIPETLRNIHVSSQLTPSQQIFLGIFLEIFLC